MLMQVTNQTFTHVLTIYLKDSNAMAIPTSPAILNGREFVVKSGFSSAYRAICCRKRASSSPSARSRIICRNLPVSGDCLRVERV